MRSLAGQHRESCTDAMHAAAHGAAPMQCRWQSSPLLGSTVIAARKPRSMQLTTTKVRHPRHPPFPCSVGLHLHLTGPIDATACKKWHPPLFSHSLLVACQDLASAADLRPHAAMSSSHDASSTAERQHAMLPAHWCLCYSRCPCPAR